MKLRAAALGLLVALAASPARASSDAPFRPLRVRYEDLASPSLDAGALAPMMDALSDVGMVSVTGLPPAFRRARDGVRASLAACAEGSGAARAQALGDGTKRTTLASHTVPGPGGIQKISHGPDGEDSAPPLACAPFDAAAGPFRAGVDAATRAFAARVAEATGAKGLLATDYGHAFDSFRDVVDGGEHLEHFHVYEKEAADEKQGEDTLEWHTDQGLLLAFSPGARAGGASAGRDDAFFVRLADGSSKRAAFDADDELVFMLGDGIEQVLNPALARDGRRSLRALPHALRVAAGSGGDAPRVWYGRMVLPPADAVHPAHGMTFGRLRDLLADEKAGTEEGEIHALGCSGDASVRTLQYGGGSSECEPGSTYCWHRCMAHEDHGVSVEMCNAQGLDLRCINPRYQLYDNSHGDWFPACIDAATAPNATEYDPLPNYPRDAETCTPEAHEAYVAENAKDYDHDAAFPWGGHFYWSVQDDGAVHGMLSYDGLFGYLSYGWAGVGPRNEMQRAHAVMAKASAEYSARYGFNFDVEPAVHLHWIGDSLSLRHWQEPLDDWGASGEGVHEIVEGDCFTALKFEARGIHDRAFNVTGTDRMMWAANGEDMFGGHHGLARAVFTVDWANGGVEVKCSMAHGKDSCTGLRPGEAPKPEEDGEVEEEGEKPKTDEEVEEEGEKLKTDEEDAELETGLPPITETDAPKETDATGSDAPKETDVPEGGAKEDKTEEVVEKVGESAASVPSFTAPAVVAALAGFVALA